MDTSLNISDFTAQLGISEVAKAVGVSVTAVRMAHTRGQYPASWFDAMDRLANEKEVLLPRELFSWKEGAA